MKRFWDKVEKTDECWLWTAFTVKGYGRFRMTNPRRMERAHRVAYTLCIGPIPEGMLVCHHCDVRNCVRPDHLFLGTIQDNNKDMFRKGRNWRGTGSKISKLTDEKVITIRAAYAHGKVSQRSIADQHCVSQVAISQIVLRKTWTHI